MAPAAKTAQTVMTLDPRTLVVNPELRARKFGPAPEAVADMAYSMITTGQDTPISVRNVAAKGADPQWCVVSGYTRTEAAILIREGFTHNDEEFKNPRFVIKALEAPKMDDAEALVKAIIENPAFLNLIEIDTGALDRLAKAMEGRVPLAGVECYEEETLARRAA